MKADYSNPYGFWEVTTEGDVEGRSTTHLGTFEGFLDEIALALADKSCYSLTFKKVNNEAADKIPKAKSVSIVLDIDSRTWDMQKDNRVKFVSELLKDRPVFVSESNYYAAVTISTERFNEEAVKKQKALNKLTDEDKRLLGL